MRELNEHFLTALFFNFVLIGALVGGVLFSTLYFGLGLWLFFVFGAIFVVSWLLARHANEPLTKSAQAIKELVRDNLHELNMPLSSIDANISMLKKSIVEQKSLKRLDRINTASLMLRERYEEVEYTLKAEFDTIEKEEFSLDELLINQIERYKELFDGYVFNYNLVPTTVNADKRGFSRVIDNLLSNAVKYSPKNSKILITLENGKLSISDNGIGMDELELLHLYERYYQADNKKTGMGIGLSLVKRYCDKEKIVISIDSKKNLGTVINLKLAHIKR